VLPRKAEAFCEMPFPERVTVTPGSPWAGIMLSMVIRSYSWGLSGAGRLFLLSAFIAGAGAVSAAMAGSMTSKGAMSMKGRSMSASCPVRYHE